jgi:hypothetical protein
LVKKEFASAHPNRELFMPFANRKKKYTFAALRRNGRAVECGGLENRCSVYTEPGVRIPLPPQKFLYLAAHLGILLKGMTSSELESCLF